MIAYIIGKVVEISEDNLVMENNCIGYNIRIPQSAAAKIAPSGEEIKIYTYTYVREDAFSLYGFLKKDDLELFKLLITVNGVGPKAALAVLSVLDGDGLRLAILSEDAKAIAKAPGVGAKIAQRVILELKGKVSIQDTAFSGESVSYAEQPAANSAIQEAVEALTALGYASSEALKAVKKVENAEQLGVEEILKTALKKIY